MKNLSTTTEIICLKPTELRCMSDIEWFLNVTFHLSCKSCDKWFIITTIDSSLSLPRGECNISRKFEALSEEGQTMKWLREEGQTM